MKTIPLFLLLCSLLPTFSMADERPNILLILADDLGYGDVGFTGAKDIYTPNLDALAKNGVICKNGYVTHTYCGPSRAGLVTGRYQARFGMEINATNSPYDMYMGLPIEEKTFGKRMQSGGYRTGIIGKWHLGASYPFHPNNRGFDYFYGFLGGGHSYWPSSVKATSALVRPDGKLDYGANEGTHHPLMRNQSSAEFDEYLTSALSKDAVRFVKSSEQPFFLYLSYNAPHTALEAPEESIKKYSHIEDRNRRIYAAMIDEMDTGIGLVIESLKETGKFENTLIWFMSDNGGVAPYRWCPNNTWADNGPFKGGKTAMYEGGSHVPYFLHWPKGLPKGVTYDYPVSSLDITATSVALGHGDTSGEPLDGVNLIPYLTGKKKDPPHAALYWRERDNVKWAVRTPKSKYLLDPVATGKPELYDMVNDPYETTNIVNEQPEERARLAALWNKWNSHNKANILMHAYEYQQRRIDMYKELYDAQKEKAKTIKPIVIQ